MKKIDVFELAQEIEERSNADFEKAIQEIVDSLKGRSLTANQIIEELVAPSIGMVSTQSKVFTVELLQKVVNELSKDDSENK